MRKIVIPVLAVVAIAILIVVGKKYALIFSKTNGAGIIVVFVLGAVAMSIGTLWMLHKTLVQILMKTSRCTNAITSVGTPLTALALISTALFAPFAGPVPSTSLSSNKLLAIAIAQALILLIVTVAIGASAIFALWVYEGDDKVIDLDISASAQVIATVVSMIVAFAALAFLFTTTLK